MAYSLEVAERFQAFQLVMPASRLQIYFFRRACRVKARVFGLELQSAGRGAAVRAGIVGVEQGARPGRRACVLSRV